MTTTITARLSGSNTCTAFGITATGYAPVLKLCRLLIQAGHRPETPLHAYRGATLCLVVTSIGEAAGFEINSGGTGFIKPKRRARAGSYVRFQRVAATTLASAAP